MADYSRLTRNWYKWAPAIGGGGGISVITTCEDCQIVFRSEDYSIHLRQDESWWIVDTINDRGQRRNAEAKLSNFELTEKYLIWDWATTAQPRLASGQLGADLARRGYAPGVIVSEADRGYMICSNADCSVLSVVNATIFSHLMSKSVDEIEQMVVST